MALHLLTYSTESTIQLFRYTKMLQYDILFLLSFPFKKSNKIIYQNLILRSLQILAQHLNTQSATQNFHPSL